MTRENPTYKEVWEELSNVDVSEHIEIIKTNREQIMNKVKELADPKIREFGIELVDVRIKRADFPEEIAESIYGRMQAERKRKADKERAEAAEVDLTVRSEVDKDATIIRAKADQEAKIIVGNAEASAIEILGSSSNSTTLAITSLI